MNVSQIQEALAAGTEFGSHTLNPADLKAVTAEDAWNEIEGSKRKLEDLLSCEINTFCYPYGRKTPEVCSMVERAGYRLACSTEKGMNTEETNPFILKRINIRRDTLVPVFIMKMLRGRKIGR